MINANFYTFEKRINSTKIPSGTATIIPIVLLDSTSVINPTLKLKYTTPNVFNYVEIPTLGYKYFITDWVSDHDFWICTCSIDAMGSFRSEIRSSTQYVQRSASEYDPDIIDSLYPAKNAWMYDFEQASTQNPPSGAAPFHPYNQGDTVTYYCVGIIAGYISSGYTQNGTVHYYIFTKDALDQFIMDISTSTAFYNITDVSDGLARQLINPLQYIVSCIQAPMGTIPEWTLNETPQGNIKFGWYTHTLPVIAGTGGTGVWSIPEGNRFDNRTFYINVPKHPESQIQYRPRSWTNMAPYSEYTFNFAPFGSFPLDSTQLYGVDVLVGYTIYEWATGDAVLMLKEYNVTDTNRGLGNILVYQRTKWGIPCPLSQMVNDALGQRGAQIDYEFGKVANVAKGISGGLDLLSSLGGAIATGGVSTGMGGTSNSVDISGAGAIADAVISQEHADYKYELTSTACSFPQVKTVGTGGSYIDLKGATKRNDPNISAKFVALVNEDNDHNGRPLDAMKQISTLSGYCQCMNASVTIDGPATLEILITSYMNGGFYIE